jgi:DNA repair photolyase
MPVWLEIIAANAVICLACYARAAHKAYKSTEKELEEAKQTIRFLENELRIAKGETAARGSKTPDFLLADDPMEALLHEVGKVRK